MKTKEQTVLDKIKDNKRQLLDILAAVSFVLVNAILILNLFTVSRIEAVVPGTVAERDIFASMDLDIPDEETTAKNRKMAEDNAPQVYNYNSRVKDVAKASLESVIKGVNEYREIRNSMESIASESKKEEREKQIDILTTEYRNRLSMYIPSSVFTSSVELDITYDIAKFLMDLIERLYSKEYVNNKEAFILNNGEAFLYDVNKEQMYLTKSLPPFIDDTELRTYIMENLKQTDLIESDERPIYYSLIKSVLKPSMSVNMKETLRLRQEAAETVETTFFKKKKGEIIVRKGDRISETSSAFIDKQNSYLKKNITFKRSIATFMLLIIAAFFVYRLVRLYKRITADKRDTVFSIVTWTLIFGVLITKISIFIVGSIGRSLNVGFLMNDEMLFYSVPYAFAAALCAILINSLAAMIVTVIMTLIVLLLTAGNIQLAVYTMYSSFAVIYLLRNPSRKTSLVYTGLFLGLFNSVFIFSITLYYSVIFSGIQLLVILFVAVLSGILTHAFVVLISPLFESIYNITTDMRLLELANMNNKLLQELSLKAAGTYQHSIQLANMAEAAAKKIGANSLLVRVGAYYHDIGKMVKHDYFVENQRMGEENKHEKLTAKMSSLILTNHVKDGVRLAEEHKLPEQIIDFIREHHGTKLMAFFYNKALAQEDNEDEVQESDYRYGGPRPGSKETAILMLADAMEAAARTLKPPVSAGKVQNLVNRIIKSIMDDNQLAESNLTFKELTMVAESFLNTLAGMFHTRIDYPGFDFNKDKDKNKEKDSSAEDALADQTKGKEEVKKNKE